MKTTNVLSGLVSLVVVSDAFVIPGTSDIESRAPSRTLEDRQNNQQTCLEKNAIQTGSAQDGSQGASAGQTKSQTDDANFINFCAGQTLTNGIQQKQGSCNGVVMGKLPAQNKMISAVIVSPQNNEDIGANQDFDVAVQLANLAAGTFTNPDSTYYAAPQDLDNSGQVIGHSHVVVQDLGNSLNPTQALDASTFSFFKGINDAGNNQGLLKTTVTGGLPAGNYRVCSMTGAANHQPVLMPVAQRGAQDDCIRFTVGGNGGSGGNNQGNNQGGKTAGQNDVDNNSNGATGSGSSTATASSSSSQESQSSNIGNNNTGSTDSSATDTNSSSQVSQSSSSSGSATSAASSATTSQSGNSNAFSKFGSGNRGGNNRNFGAGASSFFGSKNAQGNGFQAGSTGQQNGNKFLEGFGRGN